MSSSCQQKSQCFIVYVVDDEMYMILAGMWVREPRSFTPKEPLPSSVCRTIIIGAIERFLS
jgi:hypothetical protein